MTMKEWSVHSDWNFKNKVLLIGAEMHYTRGEFDEAAAKYKASIKAAQRHKFIHEEATASELAGIFFLERGLHQKSHSHFQHASECYEKWGASASAKRVEDRVREEFGSDRMHSAQAPDLLPPSMTVEGTPSNKRPMVD